MADQEPAAATRSRSTPMVWSQIRRIAITGAPGSGKTTLLAELAPELGARAHFVPEAATVLISTVGVEPPRAEPELVYDFQRAIYRIQRAFEEASMLQAMRDGKGAIVTDRGTADGIAYLHGGAADLGRVTETRRAEEHARYDAVILLAMAPRAIYERVRDNNGARRESYEEAARISHRLEEAWSDHPNYRRIDGETWRERVEAARAAILQEIER